ncbi:DUF6587 family protein [Lysobacter xanthus]
MHAGLALQYVVIALAALASALYVVRTRMPGTTRRLRGWVALRLVDSGVPRLTRLGRRIAPPARVQDACGACDGCGPKD